MKKFLALLSAAVLTAVSIPFSVSAEELIAVNAANFPDDNFRSYISSELDTDGNGYLDSFESFAVSLFLYDETEIKSLKGIELLSDLRTLRAYNCGFTEIDLSRNLNLKELMISVCQLSQIDLRNNTNLEQLVLSENNITEVDISNNTNLTS